MNLRHGYVRLLASSIVLIAAVFAIGTAQAQSDYPIRPVKVIVGFPAGSVADIVARLVGQKAAQDLGQNILVENRPGASSNIAAEMVSRAPKDGYTLFMATNANTINASEYQHLSFNIVTDFAPVMLVASVPVILVANPGLPAHNVQELITLAKAKPDKLFFGSSGTGTLTHLAGELFNLMAGVKLAHVPYKGSPEVMTDLLAGRIMIAFTPASAVWPYVQANKVHALATAGLQRTAVAPDLPTIAESGLPGFDASIWIGLLAPAGTPPQIVNRLSKALATASADPNVKAQFAKLGVDEVGKGPAEFAAYIREDASKWAKVVKQVGVKIN